MDQTLESSWPFKPAIDNVDLVFHRADAGRSPRCFFRRVLLGPGPHLPLENGLASLYLERDRLRVYFRAPQ
jgi:hypothetical protein